MIDDSNTPEFYTSLDFNKPIKTTEKVRFEVWDQDGGLAGDDECVGACLVANTASSCSLPLNCLDKTKESGNAQIWFTIQVSCYDDWTGPQCSQTSTCSTIIQRASKGTTVKGFSMIAILLFSGLTVRRVGEGA